MASVDTSSTGVTDSIHKTTGAEGRNNGEHYRLPDTKLIQEANELKIQDENGSEIKFGTLYEGKEGRRLIIFIRHFFCGHCEEYVRALCRSLPPATLAAATPPIILTVIGCGEPVCIPDYRKRTMEALGGEPYDLYCDPSRALYSKFGMVMNLQMSEQNPEYLTKSTMGSVVYSVKNILGSINKAFKAGDFRQNGGEFLFENDELRWCHRMRNTSDHAEVKELKEVLGLK